MSPYRCLKVEASSPCDAAAYITGLPKKEAELAEWQVAIEAMILVVELGGPTMLARIGVMPALNRGHFGSLILYGRILTVAAESEAGHAMKLTHRFALLTAEKRPQDPHLNGRGLRFEIMEHGGEYPDTMPQAIKLIDAAGHSCIYVPITQEARSLTAKVSRLTLRTTDEMGERKLTLGEMRDSGATRLLLYCGD